MRKTETRQLRHGGRIVFGPSAQTQRCRTVSVGTVKHVTPRGGILTAVKGGRDVWVPYHHVIRKMAPDEMDLTDF